VWLFAGLSTKALRELKRDGTVQAWGQKTLRAIKLEKLRANMGQSEPKERGFKQGFKELQGARPERIKIEKRSNEGCVSPAEHTTHLPRFLSACLSILSFLTVAPS
jgi:hypothetical protein